MPIPRPVRKLTHRQAADCVSAANAFSSASGDGLVAGGRPEPDANRLEKTVVPGDVICADVLANAIRQVVGEVRAVENPAGLAVIRCGEEVLKVSRHSHIPEIPRYKRHDTKPHRGSNPGSGGTLFFVSGDFEFPSRFVRWLTVLGRSSLRWLGRAWARPWARSRCGGLWWPGSRQRRCSGRRPARYWSECRGARTPETR